MGWTLAARRSWAAVTATGSAAVVRRDLVEAMAGELATGGGWEEEMAEKGGGSTPAMAAAWGAVTAAAWGAATAVTGVGSAPAMAAVDWAAEAAGGAAVDSEGMDRYSDA
jgi:hypothetical protein